jgi:hypothetical protein
MWRILVGKIKDEIFVAVLSKRTFDYIKVKDRWVLNIPSVIEYINTLLEKGTDDPKLSKSALEELKMALTETIENNEYVRTLKMK